MASLGAFTLDAPLAQGGMSTIWRATHDPSGAPVAVKVMSEGMKEVERRALRREIRATAALDHPHILRVLDAGEVPDGTPLPVGSPYLVMELAENGALKQRLGRTPWGLLQRMLRQLLAALAHAHARGVVHRDLKPGNVLLDADFGVQLADFGLAHAAGASRGEGVVMGTPTYMAPEQLTGAWRDFGPWTDLYALGVMTWELLSTRPPFEGDTMVLKQAHLSRDPPDFRAIVNVPPDLESWLRRLLEKSPGERYRCAADALVALESLRPPEQPRVMGGASETWADGMGGGGWVRPAPPYPAPFPAHREPPKRPLPRPMEGVGLGLFTQRRIPLVGRDQERQLLWDGLRRVHLDKRLHGVVLRGPAGVGKSHLAGWLYEEAQESGAAVVLKATHSPLGASDEGLPGALQRHFDAVGMKEPEPQVLKRLAAAGGAHLAPQLSRWMTGVPDAERTLRVQAGLLAAWVRLQDRPVLLLLDDAQWSTEALPLALTLVEHHAELPLMVVLTIREEALEGPSRERVDQLARAPLWRNVPLPPLADADTRTLLQSLLRLEGGVAHQLQERAAGNPLMVVQLLGQLVERGSLVPGRRGFAMSTEGLPSLPDTLTGVWRVRLPQLSPVDTAALERAAALGTHVSDAEWAAVAPEGADLQGIRDALLARKLAQTIPGGWTFVHGLLQEALLKQAESAGRLSAHHRACAASLPGVELALRRGKHRIEAGDLLEGLRDLELAAHIARVGANPARVEDIVQRMWDTFQALGDPPELASIKGNLWLLQGSLNWAYGRFDEAFALDNKALQLARQTGDSLMAGRALCRKGEGSRQRAKLDAARRHFAQALKLALAEGHLSVELDARCGLADVARQKRDYATATAELERAASIWAQAREQTFGAVRERASILRALGAIHRAQGDLERSRKALDLGLEAARAGGSSIMLANVINDLGDLARMEGRLDEARRMYQEAVDLWDALGSYGGVYPKLNLGLLGVTLEDVDLTIEACEAALADCALYRLHHLEGGIQVCLAWAAAAQGDWFRMQQELDLAEAGFAQFGDLDPDNAWPAEKAAAQAVMQGQVELGKQALGIALQQFLGLDDSAGIRRCRAALEVL